MRRRVIAGLSANAFGQGITIVIQLASLPMFLHYWDIKTYGIWLMLSAIPAYLSMADVGMVTAAGNKMTMALGRGDTQEANTIFHSAQLFMGSVCSLLGLIIVPIIIFIPLPGITTGGQRIALSALMCGVLIALFGGLSEAVFKATQRYAIGTLIGNVIRLVEWIGGMIGLIFVGSFEAVAILSLLARLIGTLLSIVYAQRGSYGMTWGIKDAKVDEIKKMVKPAVSFMAFPLANALSFQGVTLLVGATFGSASVAIFNTYRTISRIAVQLTGMFSHALWPEFSRLFGQGDLPAVSHLFRRSFLIGAIQSVGMSLILYLVSPYLLKFWTHGHIEFIPSLMAWLLLYAAVGGIWHIPRVFLMATNQHISLAHWSLTTGLLVVLLTWLFGKLWQVNGAGVAMLITEFLIASICAYLAYQVIAKSQRMKVTETI